MIITKPNNGKNECKNEALASGLYIIFLHQGRRENIISRMRNRNLEIKASTIRRSHEGIKLPAGLTNSEMNQARRLHPYEKYRAATRSY